MQRTNRLSNREALVKGARQCLEHQGYARTTARDVAAAAGVSLGAIGYHFGSVEALLNEALAEATRDWIARFAAIVADEARPPVALLGERVAAEFSRLVRDERPLLVAFIEALAQAERVPALREQLAEQYRQIRATAASMVSATLGDALGAAALDAGVMAAAFVALGDGLIIQMLLDPASIDLPQRLAEMLGGLAP